ncbi:MAG: terminase small subunit [Thermomicrobiales bacterium]
MNEDKLTPKQRAFVDYYLGEAHFIAQTAAKMAGYADKNAYSQGSALLKNPKIQSEIKSRLDDLQSQGMRIRVQRIEALERLLANLREIRDARAAKARERIEWGEDIPIEALSGLMVETTKTYGSGQNKITEKTWEVDKTLVQEQQRLIDQISKESGDRVADKLQLSGDANNPILVESAKAKLSSLLQDES